MDLLLVIRGLAAILVVFWHGFGAYHVNEISPLINTPGRTAVWIFFGISGYVISYGFIHKKYVFSYESLKNFYINRFLRIYPLFFLVALFAWTIEYTLSGTNPLGPKDFPSQLLGLQFDHSYILNSVFWTLGIEVQFYLIAPLLVLIFIAFSRNEGFVLGALFYLACIGLQYFLVIKYGWNYDGRNIVSNLPHFFIGMIGCALVYRIKPSIFRLLSCIVSSIFLLALSNYLYHKDPTTYWSSNGIFLIDALILLLIIAHGSIKQSICKNKAYLIFGFLGTLSYGIYAWHPLLMRFVDNIQEQPFYISIVILLFTIVIATISYAVIERPSLKLRRH
jgi:peptidoglycan/LPS O-acetylase OafA/YrhL